jgi:hypothetical protein
MARGVERRRDRPARPRIRGRGGRSCRLRRVLGAFSALAVLTAPVPVRAGNISLTLSGSINFLDASPDLVPVLGPETIDLEVKAVGHTGVPWSLTLVADSDFRSGPETIPISVVSWNASPNPPFMDGTLSTTTPALIASGLTHDFATVTFNFLMQNSWSYNVGAYSATATFTLAAP